MIPLSPAVAVGDMVYLSGIPPINEGMVVAPDNVTGQAEYILRQIDQMLFRFGMNLSCLVYVQIYLKRMEDYAAMNAVYERLMPAPYPARKVITTAFAREHVQIEINGVASGLPKSVLQ